MTSSAVRCKTTALALNALLILPALILRRDLGSSLSRRRAHTSLRSDRCWRLHPARFFSRQKCQASPSSSSPSSISSKRSSSRASLSRCSSPSFSASSSTHRRALLCFLPPSKAFARAVSADGKVFLSKQFQKERRERRALLRISTASTPLPNPPFALT